MNDMPVPPPLAIAAVLLFSPDPARLAAFYREHLGVPLRRVAVPDLDEHWACDIGPVYLSIWPLAGAASGPSRGGVALYVADVPGSFERLSALGLAVDFAPRRTRLGVIARLRDPDGNPLELYSPGGICGLSN